MQHQMYNDRLKDCAISGQLCLNSCALDNTFFMNCHPQEEFSLGTGSISPNSSPHQMRPGNSSRVDEATLCRMDRV